MKRNKAIRIVCNFFKDMNSEYWDGIGNKPESFIEGVWEYPLNKEVHLEIVFVYDDIDGWHHCCDLVDNNSNDSIEMLSGYGIDSSLNLVDTVMDLCKEYR